MYDSGLDIDGDGKGAEHACLYQCMYPFPILMPTYMYTFTYICIAHIFMIQDWTQMEAEKEQSIHEFMNVCTLEQNSIPTYMYVFACRFIAHVFMIQDWI